jgi:Competence protein
MSVAACLGLALVTPHALRWGERRLPLRLAGAVATSVGAQIGVSAIMIPVFGGVPLVAVPANLLALPAAEPVMAWGVAAGLPAGFVQRLLGDGPARVVHVPTQLALRWVRFVATRASNVPLGELSLVGAAFVAAVVFGRATVARRGSATLRRRSSVLAAATVLSVALLAAQGPSDAVFAPGAEASHLSGRIGRHVDVLVLRQGVRVDDVLGALRRRRVGAIDLLVVASGGRRQRDPIRAIAHRSDIGAVLVADRAVAGSVRPVVVGRAGMVVRSGRRRVRIDAVRGTRLTITITTVEAQPRHRNRTAAGAATARPAVA